MRTVRACFKQPSDPSSSVLGRLPARPFGCVPFARLVSCVSHACTSSRDHRDRPGPATSPPRGWGRGGSGSRWTRDRVCTRGARRARELHVLMIDRLGCPLAPLLEIGRARAEREHGETAQPRVGEATRQPRSVPVAARRCLPSPRSAAQQPPMLAVCVCVSYGQARALEADPAAAPGATATKEKKRRAGVRGGVCHLVCAAQAAHARTRARDRPRRCRRGLLPRS